MTHSADLVPVLRVVWPGLALVALVAGLLLYLSRSPSP